MSELEPHLDAVGKSATAAGGANWPIGRPPPREVTPDEVSIVPEPACSQPFSDSGRGAILRQRRIAPPAVNSPLAKRIKVDDESSPKVSVLLMTSDATILTDTIKSTLAKLNCNIAVCDLVSGESCNFYQTGSLGQSIE